MRVPHGSGNNKSVTHRRPCEICSITDSGAARDTLESAALFSKEIDWRLIETHWQDMMQVVLSIQAGLVLPSMLLRKLGSLNRKSRLCQAFRELGRVERTLFLLDYITNSQIRRTIRAETTKIESFNDFLDWITYGGPIIKSGDPVEQEKQLRYATLVANAIMLSNVADLTEVLSSMHAVTRSFLLPTRSGCRRSRYSGNLTGNSNRGLFGAHASHSSAAAP
jgi:TnpA family transposase